MTVINYGMVKIDGRAYPNERYRIDRYEGSDKINLWTGSGTGVIKSLKMTLEECEELITRLQFAVHEAKNA